MIDRDTHSLEVTLKMISSADRMRERDGDPKGEAYTKEDKYMLSNKSTGERYPSAFFNKLQIGC